MKLSLCLITFNEEKNIHLPMNSAYDIADEVILVDGGSTDKTVEIVKSYGDKVKVHHVDNPPNFLTNKQRAIEFAHGEWILQLDADESLTPELKKEILEIIKSDTENTTYAGYMIPRKNWFLRGYLMKGGVYPDPVLRLYKRHGAHFALKNVHENVIIDGEIGWLKNPIDHYADPDFARYLYRWNVYTTFDANQIIEKKEKIGFFNYMIWKPFQWFMLAYFRHKGFMDGFHGFVFHYFSALRFVVIYIKVWQAGK
jgi:glycosyltransferase involved in cell wall biosynthesis